MKKGTVKIGDNSFDVDIAIKEEEKYKGLSGTDKLEKGKGMLFLFSKPQEVFFVMRDMNYPLDIIFIDDEGVVSNIVTAEKDSKEDIESNGKIKAVLELNKGESENFKVNDIAILLCDNKVSKKVVVKSFHKGGELTSDPGNALKIGDIVYDDITAAEGIELNDDGYYVLNDDKEAIYKIRGGERVFSIDDTKDITDLSVSYQKGDVDSSELGKLMVAVINRQDNQTSQFVAAAKDGSVITVKGINDEARISMINTFLAGKRKE